VQVNTDIHAYAQVLPKGRRMTAQEIAMLEIIAVVNDIEGVETKGIFISAQSNLEMTVLAAPAINYVILYSALRDLGLSPVIQHHSKLSDGKHGVHLRIDIAARLSPKQ
jgi:hypothetical protein